MTNQFERTGGDAVRTHGASRLGGRVLQGLAAADPLVQAVSSGVIAAFTVWQADSIHIIKHVLGDPTVRLHYNSSDHWIAFSHDYCLNDAPSIFGSMGTHCPPRPGERVHGGGGARSREVPSTTFTRSMLVRQVGSIG